MSTYKRYSVRLNICILCKKMKYLTIWEKVSNIIKTNFNSELIYNKFYLEAEKIFNTKESFQCSHAPAILIDSINRKNENYYP